MFRERNVGRSRVIPTRRGSVVLSLLVGLIVVAGCTTHRDLDSAAGVGTGGAVTDGATTTLPASFITLPADSGALVTSPPAGETLPPLVAPGDGSTATSLASSSPPVPPTSVFTVSSTVAPRPAPTPTTPLPTPTTQAVAPIPTCAAKGSTGGVGNGAGALSPLVGADIRVGLHECFERIVIELRGEGSFPGFSVGYGDASVAGGAALLITLGSSMAGGGTGYSGATDIFPSGFALIKELRLTSDSDGQMVWAIGVDQQRKFVVSHLSDPARLVVDIQK